MNTKPVVVGVDGGPDSIRALQWAADYAASFGATLIALTAYEVTPIAGPYAMAGWEDPAEVEKSARSMLAGVVADTLGDGVDVKQYVLRGHPAEAMVEASKDAGLVVVGSRGRGGFKGLLLGSVSQHVVSHSHCPVVVLPTHVPDKDTP